MNRVKVVTLCGSRKFAAVFKKIETDLALRGNVVLGPVFNVGGQLTAHEVQLLRAAHFKKIELADEVLVIDVNEYVGPQTQKEIAYARTLNRVIKYYSQGESAG
ncbi:hypothetical protein D1831_09090 [Lactiplantibacillus garii]|uniref:Uncharacterized protein n=1 Tax=Lactiplantibacillus garii TaxID=2306423 RepID=A0A3R8LJE6_9LACO|nr:hypothetical protein [Lactiplantibacillus garii]RRK10107.1 hypothetical protein D1831_09090 [Lactiplantibacillus garii]